MSPRPVRRAAVAAFLGAVTLLGGCGSGHRAPAGAPAPSPTAAGAAPSTTAPAAATGSTAPPGPAGGGLGPGEWMLQDFDIPALLGAGLSQATLAAYFDTPRTYLIVKAGHPSQDALLPHATKVMSFTAVASLSAAIAARSIPADVHWILYDNESWAATPKQEQLAPIPSAQQAEALAHGAGYHLIFTPAADLAPVLDHSYTSANRFEGYLALDLASQGAKVADVLEIQAQQDEAGPSFASFVSGAVGQARSASSTTQLLVGITTYIRGQVVTAQTLFDAWSATHSEVAGYWINIPGGTGNGPEDPAVAVGFLQQLAHQIG